MKISRWLTLMQTWGFDENRESFEALVKAYGETSRYYHGTEHIRACLRHLDRVVPGLKHAHEVELALWFHDAIYKSFSNSNEKDSADWAADFLRSNNADSESITRVHQLIMATEHQAPTQTVDESFLVDIDLSILGASTEHYEQFEQGVRQEYRLVPGVLFKKKRAAILQGFLDQSCIYHNEPFVSELEARARTNLNQAIAALQSH